jgi:hypothetical protein
MQHQGQTKLEIARYALAVKRYEAALRARLTVLRSWPNRRLPRLPPKPPGFIIPAYGIDVAGDEAEDADGGSDDDEYVNAAVHVQAAAAAAAAAAAGAGVGDGG